MRGVTTVSSSLSFKSVKEEPDSATQNAVVHIPGRGPAEREKDAHGAPRGSST